MNRLEQKVEKLKKTFPGIQGIKLTENGRGVWLGDAAEGGEIDGIPAADYYGEFRGGYPWRSPKLEKACKEMGLFIEWDSPGTLSAWPD